MHVVNSWSKYLLVVAILLMATSSLAKKADESPHGTDPIKRFLHASIVFVDANGEKKPFVGMASLEILQNGQTLFMIPKETDKKGSVSFGSIDTHPFSYRVHAEVADGRYMSQPVSLHEDQTSADVELLIGPGAPESSIAAIDDGASPQGMPAAAHANRGAEGQWAKQQGMAVLLGVLVLLFLAVQLRKNKSTPHNDH